MKKCFTSLIANFLRTFVQLSTTIRGAKVTYYEKWTRKSLSPFRENLIKHWEYLSRDNFKFVCSASISNTTPSAWVMTHLSVLTISVGSGHDLSDGMRKSIKLDRNNLPSIEGSMSMPMPTMSVSIKHYRAHACTHVRTDPEMELMADHEIGLTISILGNVRGSSEEKPFSHSQPTIPKTKWSKWWRISLTLTGFETRKNPIKEQHPKHHTSLSGK